MKRCIDRWIFLGVCIPGMAFAVSEDDAAIFNQTIQQMRAQLQEKFAAANLLVEEEADGAAYQSLLKQVRHLKQQITLQEETWRHQCIQNSDRDEAVLWDLGEVTLSQLVMEYGATDHLYIIPPELSSMKLSVHCNLPIPRESWEEMVAAICTQNGIGVKPLNSFAKQLYVLKLDPSSVEAVIDAPEKLGLFSHSTRVCYVISPPIERLKETLSFFERFSDPKQTAVYAVGSKITLISNRDTIEKLLEVYRVVWEQKAGKTAKLARFHKIRPEEGERVLKALFHDGGNKIRPPFQTASIDELMMLSVSQGLVLVGQMDTVERAQQMIDDLEASLDNPGEKVVYWYGCKHSNPEDVAQVLNQVYDSLSGGCLEKTDKEPPIPSKTEPLAPTDPLSRQPFQPNMPAQAPFVQPATMDKKERTVFGSFIVDHKTTSILMVVRKEDLPKIKELLKKLDRPKRMVQLDVLLVEKKLTDRRQMGINLLQIGSNASHTQKNAIAFDNQPSAENKGVLSFLISRPSHKPIPFDLMYHFLLGQEDIRINANPSVLAVNQTSAQISIVEEISINNGAIPIQVNSSGAVSVEKSYTRAQYGITIQLTPTIHFSEDGETLGFVSLETNLEFDTTKTSTDDRPPVSRRHIENQVCVADGETVVLGGLRRKVEENSQEKIPFLGDLPGLGKFFGITHSIDTSTETFIFITPHIVRDGIDDLRKIRQMEYQKRAGDIPEFLQALDDAKEKEQTSALKKSIQLLFGPNPS